MNIKLNVFVEGLSNDRKLDSKNDLDLNAFFVDFSNLFKTLKLLITDAQKHRNDHLKNIKNELEDMRRKYDFDSVEKYYKRLVLKVKRKSRSKSRSKSKSKSKHGGTPQYGGDLLLNLVRLIRLLFMLFIFLSTGGIETIHRILNNNRDGVQRMVVFFENVFNFFNSIISSILRMVPGRQMETVAEQVGDLNNNLVSVNAEPFDGRPQAAQVRPVTATRLNFDPDQDVRTLRGAIEECQRNIQHARRLIDANAEQLQALSQRRSIWRMGMSREPQRETRRAEIRDATDLLDRNNRTLERTTRELNRLEIELQNQCEPILLPIDIPDAQVVLNAVPIEGPDAEIIAFATGEMLFDRAFNCSDNRRRGGGQSKKLKLPKKLSKTSKLYSK